MENQRNLRNPNLTGDNNQEIFHFSHPQHPLWQVDLPYLFTCTGCKEYGAGRRFRCRTCDFDLHEFCALASPSLHGHPSHEQHQLVFFIKPGGFGRSRCDICSKSTKGYAFCCTLCNFEMHPCCAKLERDMDFPIHPHKLTLLPLCALCRRKRFGRLYRCATCEYQLHALCAKDMVNGLYAHGIKAPEKPSLFAVAARVASQALIGLVGAIIEGIGEGIGEGLVGGIVKTREGGVRGRHGNASE
ncbi:hypothetical protein QJS04_geneDACA001437 [Acorus gramineus]|uniref:DC1 domain-containing protein n=1 Tax=Acorus gramineus TaxID=55184 RepID=A0AAV9A7C9_ACOGR|nr:hypothetical protein QJS04_geneDACA001437 [Acorus gramineus]